MEESILVHHQHKLYKSIQEIVDKKALKTEKEGVDRYLS